jgi:molybdenum cofactor guanylyltransferase
MIGIILCGGRSSRMGSDKALLKTASGITWVQAAVSKLTTLAIPVHISVNQYQVDRYLGLFSIHQLVPDNSQLLLKGPLLGILSAHLQYPEEDLFVLACDMPLIEPAILEELHLHYLSNPGDDAYVFTRMNEPEPLCGIYRAESLRHLMSLYQQQQLTRYHMKFALEQINTAYYPATAAQQRFFHNVNTPADLNDW